MASDTIEIKVILGSTRPNRFSEKPGAWIMEQLKKRDDVRAELLDLRDYLMPFFEETKTPSSKKEPYKNEAVVRWTAKIKEGDAFIVIAPEYNHGYSAVLKNAMDYVYQEWNGKPIGFVTYGSALGARSVEQLRLVAVELQMAPIRNAIHLPREVVAAAKAGDGAAFDALEERAGGLIDQLLWWARALKAARSA